MKTWPLLAGLGVLAGLWHLSNKRAQSARPINLDHVLNALWKRPWYSARGMESARRVYKLCPDICLANQTSCVAYWRRELEGEGVWETIDVGIRGISETMLMRFLNGRIQSWEIRSENCGSALQSSFDIEEDLVSGEVLRRVRYAIERDATEHAEAA